MAAGNRWRSSLFSGFLAGFLTGEIFLGVGLLRTGGDLLALCPTREHAVWLVVRSAGIYGLMFAALGLALAAVVRLASLLAGRDRWPVFAWVAGAMVSLTLLAYLTVWWQLDVISWLPLGSPERRAGALRHLAYALAAGALAGGALLAWSRRGKRTWAWARARASRLALPASAFGLLLVGASEIGLAHLAPPGGRVLESRDPRRPPSASGAPRRVIVVGFDGMTFRILSPLLRAGELPSFRRLLAEGAWGTYLTYGTQSSPLIWTSMATGRRVRDHGIDDFVRASGGYQARPLKSYDRKSPALWNILSLLERRVAVVNWLVTSPPETVDGYVVSRLAVGDKGATYPKELQAELDPLLGATVPADGSLRATLTSETDRVFAVALHLLRRERLDLLMLYDHSADSVEHLRWRSYEPLAFDPELWPPDPIAESDAATLVPDVYRRLDRKLGELMEAMPDDALLIVVSDHGQRPTARPRIHWRMDRVLARLGHAQLDAGSDRADYTSSQAYTLVETASTPTLRVNINLKGREGSGIVDPKDKAPLAARIVSDLRALESDGRPLFDQVVPGGTKGGGSDIVLVPSAVLLAQLARASARQRSISVGGRPCRLDDLLDVDISTVGDHDRQGVIFVRGPGVRPGPIGQRAVTTPIQELVWRLTDKVDAVDAGLPLLRRLGLIERATTLDLAPTVLYALGLPVARDMAGRPLTELFSGLPGPQWTASYDGRVPAPARHEETGSDAEALERLRALGYIR